MKNQINIAELLEDCPKGMELYSPIFGKVYLDKVRPHLGIVVATDKYKEEFLYDGRYGINGECMLFPSKEKTTWEGFASPGKFKDGDVCYIKTKKFEHIFIFKVNENYNLIQEHAGLCEDHFYTENPVCTIDDVKEHRLATEEEKQKLFGAIKANGYRWNEETKSLEKLPKFKDGDILFVKAAYSWIIIYKESENEGELYKYVGIPVGIPDYLNHTFMVYDCNHLCCKDDISEIRLATEEEKKKLFDAIKENSFEWNSETKTFEKVIEPKFKVGDIIQDIDGYKVRITDVSIEDGCYGYESLAVNGIVNGIGGISFNRQDNWELVPTKFDITKLKPFKSEVLVRDSAGSIWRPAIFGCIDKSDCVLGCYYVLGGICWRYCIPYEGNEHLLGKTDDCEEYYKIWE